LNDVLFWTDTTFVPAESVTARAADRHRGLDVRYERVPGGFEMFAAAVNDGPACANSVGGGTTIKNAAPPNLTLDFSWSLPATQIIQPGEHFNYRIGVMTDEQARSFLRLDRHDEVLRLLGALPVNQRSPW
jgi:hypothetical protein